MRSLHLQEVAVLLASRLSNSAISSLTNAPHSPAVQIALINLAGIIGTQAAQGVFAKPLGPNQLKNDVGESCVEVSDSSASPGNMAPYRVAVKLERASPQLDSSRRHPSSSPALIKQSLAGAPL